MTLFVYSSLLSAHLAVELATRFRIVAVCVLVVPSSLFNHSSRCDSTSNRSCRCRSRSVSVPRPVTIPRPITVRACSCVPVLQLVLAQALASRFRILLSEARIRFGSYGRVVDAVAVFAGAISIEAELAFLLLRCNLFRLLLRPPPSLHSRTIRSSFCRSGFLRPLLRAGHVTRLIVV